MPRLAVVAILLNINILRNIRVLEFFKFLANIQIAVKLEPHLTDLCWCCVTQGFGRTVVALKQKS